MFFTKQKQQQGDPRMHNEYRFPKLDGMTLLTASIRPEAYVVLNPGFTCCDLKVASVKNSGLCCVLCSVQYHL